MRAYSYYRISRTTDKIGWKPLKKYGKREHILFFFKFITKARREINILQFWNSFWDTLWKACNQRQCILGIKDDTNTRSSPG